jgi:hypothetical protein
MRYAACAALLLSLAACAARNAPSGAPGEREGRSEGGQVLEGRLEGGLVAIGGETTGYRLVTDEPAGAVECDVSAVQAEADSLVGRRVRARGRFERRDYVERGPLRVFVVEAIEAVR